VSGVTRALVDDLGRRVEAAEGAVLEIVGMLLERQAARQRHDDPVVVRDSLDGTPLVRLSDVRLDEQGARPARSAPADDPQRQFVELAEQVAREFDLDPAAAYREAARSDPDLWRAARGAASLQGGAETFDEQAARQLAEGS
jgi:leucyl aminopeptidase (aminopeptidase T)